MRQEVLEPPPPPPPVSVAGMPGQTTRVALLLPLTGPSAQVGEAMLNSAQLALFHWGKETMTLLPLDTHGNAEGAAAAAGQAIAQQADLVLGPLFSAEVKAAAPVVQSAGRHMLAFTTDRTAGGNGIFVMGFLPRVQIDRVVSHAIAQGKTRFAAFAPSNDYGRTMVEALKEVAAMRGALVADIGWYDPQAADLRDSVRHFVRFDERKKALGQQKAQLAGRTDPAAVEARQKLDQMEAAGDLGFDALLLPDEGVRLKNVASLLAYYDAGPDKVRYLGTMLWGDSGLKTEPALLGAWYPTAPLAEYANFEGHFVKAFGEKPSRLASLAYDATALAAVISRDAGDFGMARLTDPRGFGGVSGIFRLNPDGGSDRGLEVVELTPEGLRIVAPAPATFESVGQ
ncbi:MAG: penicillin-binding protein activator [Alphaproteobacteria bacterium]|nr:penicillin-binding protein activator [Alphaproteobacteria bacterium]